MFLCEDNTSLDCGKKNLLFLKNGKPKRVQKSCFSHGCLRTAALQHLPGWTEEDEAGDWFVWIVETRPGTLNGLRHHPHSLVLANYSFVQLRLEVHQLVAFARHQLAGRNT